MKKSFEKHQKTWIIAGTIMLLALLATYIIFQFSPTQTISVNGQSQIEVIPDILTMNFLIESIATTASEASDTNTEKYNAFVSSITSLGVYGEKIKTTNINVQKNYEWNNGQRVDKGYIATHNVKIELDSEETNKLSQILDEGIGAGALISYINFELSSELEKGKEAEAIQAATENARSKAENIAQGLDAKLGSIVSVTDSNTYYNPPYIYYAEGSVARDAEASGESAKAAISGINPNGQTVQATVQVVYKIR